MEAQSRKYTRNKLLFKEKEVSLRGSPGTSAALVAPFHFHSSLESESSFYVSACLLPHPHPHPPKPGLLAAWLSCDMEELTVSMVTVTHWYGRSQMKYKAGNVSFPQPLAPCGTGMLALSLTVSGRKELRH